MKIILNVAFLLLSVVVFGQEGFEKGNKGLLYKIVKGNETDGMIKVGEFVQFSQKVLFGDSTVRNSYESGNEFNKIDSIDQPLSITEVIKKMKVGDSAMIKLSCDTIVDMQWPMAQQQGMSRAQFEKQMPAFILQKGNYITIGIRLIQKYTSDSLAMIDVKAQEPLRQAYQQKMQAIQMAEQAKKDKAGFAGCDKEFKKFMATKPKTLKKTPSGAYVQILKEGVGAICKKGQKVELRYKGMLFNGSIFDGNIIEKGKPTKPTLPVTVMAGGMIKGFDEAIALLKKGTKARVFIPCNLGYGGQSPSADLPAYSNLIFEVEVVSVK
jgi:FKBP-type peptidyl-prolyl cis-trans isomerase FkpA